MPKKRNTPRSLFIKEVKKVMKKRVQQVWVPLNAKFLDAATRFMYIGTASVEGYCVCCMVTAAQTAPGETPSPMAFEGSVRYLKDTDTDKEIGAVYIEMTTAMRGYSGEAQG